MQTHDDDGDEIRSFDYIGLYNFYLLKRESEIYKGRKEKGGGRVEKKARPCVLDKREKDYFIIERLRASYWLSIFTSLG